MSATVSIVVTVYNKAPYLPPVLRSLAAQEGNFSWEYIFVNDGSSDNSVAVIHDMTAGWPNVKIITQKNQGPASATNTGIEAATGEYVKLLDADDVLHPQAVLRLLTVLAKYPEAVAAFAAIGGVTSNDVVESFTAPRLPIGTGERIYTNPLPRIFKNHLFNPSQVLVRRTALQACEGCDPAPEVAFIQDYTLNLRLARLGAFIELDDILVHATPIVEGRVSGNRARELGNLNRALASFLRQFPSTSGRLQSYAVRHAAGRALRWSRRINKRWWLFDPAFWRQVRSLFPIKDAPRFIEATTVVFQEKPR
ncbi:MAG: glycosyltransferase family 2 protein [Holosporales bacterium]